MMDLVLSQRAKLGLLLVLLFGLLMFLPLRVAMNLFSLDRQGISAHSVEGSIWNGRIEQLAVGNLSLGTVHAGLSPIQLFVGRARLDVSRKAGLPDDIEGALTFGFHRIGIDDVTGNVPLGTALAPLPISGLNFTDASAYFSGGGCGHAEGRVKAWIAGEMPGLNLSQGLTGDIRCDGDAVLLPLVSQSGLEKINLHITADGHYTFEMRVTNSDPALGQSLGAAGFRQAGNGYALRVAGAL